jgi:CRISPR-associated protein Cas1
MTDRILDLAGGPAHVRAELEQLRIEPRRPGAGAGAAPDDESSGGSDAATARSHAARGRDGVSIPMSDIAVVVLAHPQITCTQSALAGILRHGGAVVICDQAVPVGLLAPLVGHSTQGERIVAQAAAKLPLRKRLWQQIVRAKVRAQADLLDGLRGHDGGLRAMLPRVRSGDPENTEAQAAQRYWPLLFDDPAFRRRRDAPDANRMLNYGYAVLRAIVARAVCAAGLHPSLGLHHHNRYDAYSLAADLMEPFRPLVDAAVVECVRMHGADSALTPAVKQTLLEPLTGLYRAGGEARSLFDWVARTSGSLAGAFLGQNSRLDLPEGLNREDSADAPL